MDKDETPILSTGQPSTLGVWHDNCCAVFGAGSAPALYFSEKIKTAKKGRDEAVLAPETQVMHLIANMMLNPSVTPK